MPKKITDQTCFRCGGDIGGACGRLCQTCKRPSGPKRRGSPLTFREDQVVQLVAQAKLNKEIAGELHLTEGTVKEYLSRIFRKLEVTNRTGLAIWALKRAGVSAGRTAR